MEFRSVCWQIVCVFLSALLLNGTLSAEKTVDPLYVYNEAGNETYLWHPSGWMPDGGGISYTDRFKEACHRGETCIKAGFQTGKKPYWAGIYWLPVGSWEGPGIDIYNSLKVDKKVHIKLTFWAKGKTGKERVQFKVGGVADGKDSIKFPAETDYVTLSTEWKQYMIDLVDKDLSNIVGGFCWVANKDQNMGQSQVWFFLDDIRYEVVK